MGKTTTQTIHVKGMFCTNCERRVQDMLLDIPGVIHAKASFEDEEVSITYDEDEIHLDVLMDNIEALGYEADAKGGGYIQIASVLVILLAACVIAGRLGWTRSFNLFPTIETSASLGMLFVIGLLTSVHCIAMCGGINLAQSTMTAKHGNGLVRSNIAYNAGRVISYTVIGGVVGGIGSMLSFHGVLRGAIAVAAGTLMLLMALSMLGLFKPLRKLPLHLPKGLYRKMNGIMKGRSSFFLGLLNGFMPCGPLQSMQIYALSAGSTAMGALSMLSFSLGTVPLMFGFGLFSGKLNRKYARYMLTVSAFLIFIMGIQMAGNGLALSGASVFSKRQTGTGKMAEVFGDVQRVTTEVDYGSYESITVRKGIPVEWTIIVPDGKLNGCNGEMEIPAYDMTVKLSAGENVVTFTPEQTGTVPYSCWMGMIKSSIEVVN